MKPQFIQLSEIEHLQEHLKPLTPAQKLMGEAVDKLQGQQKQVYILTVRLGRSLADAAKELHLSKWTVRTYHDRALRFITQYCRSAIRRGEV